jgi:transcriptional regulator with XRE-family HTH domain
MTGSSRSSTAVPAPQPPDTGEEQPDEASDEAVAAIVGAAIRRRRAAAGLSLSELARRADLSVAFCSQIEAGRANPTLSALARIARSLGVGLAALMPSDATTAEFAPIVRRRGDLPAPSRFRVREWTALGATLVRATLVEGPEAPAGHPERHAGEEICVVLGGSYTLTVGARVETLGPGDVAHYPATTPHTLVPTGRDATALLVLGEP